MLLIVGIMLSGGLSLYGDRLNAQRTQDTDTKLDRIEAALYAYVQAYGTLPCPAIGNVGIDQSGSTSPALPSGVNAFGRMTCDPSKYATSAISGYGAGALRKSFGGSRYMLVGAVPTRTLGIPDAYAFDAWNDRFMYAVDNDYSYDSAGTTPQWTGNNPQLVVRAFNDSDEKTNRGGAGGAGAVYVLFSYGPNTWGSWRDKANTNSVRNIYELTGTIKGTKEMENAQFNTSSGITTDFDEIWRDAPRRLTTDTSTYFDDMVRWKTRFQF